MGGIPDIRSWTGAVIGSEVAPVETAADQSAVEIALIVTILQVQGAVELRFFVLKDRFSGGNCVDSCMEEEVETV